MKNLNKVLVGLFVISFISCSQKTTFTIDGTVHGIKTGKVYLRKFYNKMFFTTDSATINDGNFHFDGNLTLPELYGLSLDTASYPLFVFLKEKDKLKVEIDTSDIEKSKITGSADNDLFRQYKQSNKDIKIDSFIRQHPRSIVAAYILYRDYSYRLTPEEIEKNISLLDPAFSQTQYVRLLHELVEVLKRVAVGQKAIDFALPDTSGKQVKLSDHFGKYLLLDFWASWCPPCRQENPNLVKAYQQYKNEGFDIVSVSLDKKKEKWIKGINDDKLTWTHVSDLKYWNSEVARLYGIRAIPSNLLIDKSGVIIAKNLRGEDLEKKLIELFNK